MSKEFVGTLQVPQVMAGSYYVNDRGQTKSWSDDQGVEHEGRHDFVIVRSEDDPSDIRRFRILIGRGEAETVPIGTRLVEPVLARAIDRDGQPMTDNPADTQAGPRVYLTVYMVSATACKLPAAVTGVLAAMVKAAAEPTA